MRQRKRNRTLAASLASLLLLFMTACSGNGGNGGNDGNAQASEETPVSDYTKAVKVAGAVTDGTKELYDALGPSFVKNWKERTGQDATVEQSAASSNFQKDAVIGGQSKADFVSLSVGIDIDEIMAKGLIADDWQQRYDYISSPFYTDVAFVVRAGNPKGIAGWEDVAEADNAVVVANPSAYSDARWYYAAPWAFSLDRTPDDQEAAKAFVTGFHERVSVLAESDAAAEKAFVEEGKGDVWVTTESNALRVANGAGQGKVEVVVPPVTLTVEPIVSVVDANADANGSREAANAYADYLFTEEAQTLAAEHYFRPSFASVAEQFAERFPETTLLTVDDNLTGWEDLQAALFAEGGLYGQLPAK